MDRLIFETGISRIEATAAHLFRLEVYGDDDVVKWNERFVNTVISKYEEDIWA